MYPKPDDGHDDAPELTALGAARLPPAPLARLPRARCAGPGPSCGLAVVDPDGRGVHVGGGDGGTCRLWRWAPGEEAAEEAAECAVPIYVPPWADPANLVAALAPNLYVYRDGMVIRRYDRVADAHDGRPLVGDPSELYTRASADGRALLFLTVRGAAMRVDASGFELLSVEQRPCALFQPPVVAPDARWAAWTCSQVDGEGENTLTAGEIVRVSSAGMERFQGVPMWALAIDDDGDLLLHSRDDLEVSIESQLPVEAPRNLYVLSADGQLARVDALEPDPELMRGLGSGVYRWIAAQAF
jgi:hypothetical protein